MVGFRPLYVLLAFLSTGIAACAAPGGAPAPAPDANRDPAAVRWTVANRPDVDLWYYGLAYTGLGASAEIPLYQPEYVERLVAAKRAAGAYPTPLDRRAEEFARQFRTSANFSRLQFLPLYFSGGDALFASLRAWAQVEGDPRRVQDPALAQAVAFLSQQFPSASERRILAGWVQLLDEEQRAFYGRYHAERLAELGGITAAVQARWDQLAPRLQPYLDYMILNGGELVLSLPLGSEGRTLDLGRRQNRVAVGMPVAGAPADAVWAFVHELAYPLVGPVIQDQLAPAQRRETDEQLLSRRAAVRTGAILLDRVAPDAAAEYRAAYLRWAGVAVPMSAQERARQLERAYPLPEPLPPALAEAVDRTLGGI
jgi:hypothetical protein